MASAKKTIKLEQIASPARRHHDQRETLIGLKLNKVGRTSEMPDTPQTHGMVRKLNHLVRIVNDKK
jgi:large subunit ribosomal protein L30